MPKVSVIIPVYRVEKYIERCARSLFEQTLDDIEFIFVDDCTDDNSIKILLRVLEDYPNRRQCVIVLHNEQNLGLPRTRRVGLKEAKGDYIIHCDSDDWVSLDLYEKMYEKALSLHADLVVCDYVVVTNTSETIRKGISADNKTKYIENLLYQRDSVCIWNKMYKRDVYRREIEEPSYNMGEDMAVTLQLTKFCDIISFVTESLYYYNGTSLSITRKETKKAIIDRATQACNNARIVERAYIGDGNRCYENGLIHLKFMQRKKYMPAINYKDVLQMWRNTFPEINIHILINPKVDISIRDRVIFMSTLSGLFPLVKSIFRKNIVAE